MSFETISIIASYLLKVANFSYRYGWGRWNFNKTFGIWKLKTIGYLAVVLVMKCLFVLIEYDMWRTDTQTHRQKQSHSIYRTSIASRDKNDTENSRGKAEISKMCHLYSITYKMSLPLTPLAAITLQLIFCVIYVKRQIHARVSMASHFHDNNFLQVFNQQKTAQSPPIWRPYTIHFPFLCRITTDLSVFSTALQWRTHV